MDALARVAQIDPVAFRTKNLSSERMRAILEAVANSFGWPGKKIRDGQGFDVAVGNEKGSYVATCAEIAVDPSGALKVVRVVEAFECGAIINPDGLRNQVVGAIIQGLGGALFEAVRFKNSRITNPHLASYRVPRFRDVPAIETILLDRKDIAPAGAGETPIMAIARHWQAPQRPSTRPQWSKDIKISTTVLSVFASFSFSSPSVGRRTELASNARRLGLKPHKKSRIVA